MNKIILAATLFALALPAYADTTINGKVSTLGVGLEAAFAMTDSIDARIGLNTFNYNFNRTATSNGLTTNYTGKLDLQSLEALADWHPWVGSFRVSGGIVYNNNKFNMTGQPDAAGNINIGGTTYAVGAGQFVNASVDFRKVAPYLGIGWGRTPKNAGLSFTSDLGILFQGKPRGSVTTNIPGANINQANVDLNASLKNFDIYPVVSVGIGYIF